MSSKCDAPIETRICASLGSRMKFKTLCYPVVRWFRRMTNVELHKIAAIEPLEYYIRRMRLRWTGHVYRLQEITPARAILKYQPKPVRPIGHPTNRFQDTLKLDCSRAGPDYRLQNIETVAADRTQWRKFVRAATGDG